MPNDDLATAGCKNAQSNRLAETDQRTLLIAIPCLNEEATVGRVIAELPRTIPGIDRIDILVVDDGSTDSTSEVARRAGAFALRHSYNRGLGKAFQTAVSYAVQHDYDFMVNIDGDGQFSSGDVHRLLAPLFRSEADMVTACRFVPGKGVPNMPRAKLAGNWLMSRLISKLVGRSYRDVSCGFRSYSREALLNINLHGRFTYTQETFLDLSEKEIRIAEVDVDVRYFAERRSRVARSLLRYGIQTSLIIFRSYRDYFPLKFFSFIAGLFALPATVLACYFFGHFFLTGRFSGILYIGFISAFLFGISAMFIVLAIVTDMLDRLRVNQERILYLMKKGASITQALPPVSGD